MEKLCERKMKTTLYTYSHPHRLALRSTHKVERKAARDQQNAGIARSRSSENGRVPQSGGNWHRKPEKAEPGRQGQEEDRCILKGSRETNVECAGQCPSPDWLNLELCKGKEKKERKQGRDERDILAMVLNYRMLA